jgi:uncharacterized protein (DUF2235 family)
MARNLVICCDGTNNSLSGVLTNVGRIAALADVGDKTLQLPYYDAGVGVEAKPGLHTRIGSAVSRWSGSAFGTGLVANVEQAYLHLVREYSPGDRIYLFGFSRGAYTVRVIAGLLNNYGLLRKENEALVPKVVRAFRNLFPDKDSDKPDPGLDQRFEEARRYLRESSLIAPVHFMGLFDTVSSLGWAWDPKTFPNTSTMPNVKVVRHALALDERRAKFRTNRIRALQEMDHRQVWFAGVHSDVGGGYKAPNDRLARIPLRWMLAEARAAQMLVNTVRAEELDLDGSYLRDEQEPQNESLTAMWKALEHLPLPHREFVDGKWVESRRTYRGKGWRKIVDANWLDSYAHESLQRRRIAVKNANWAAAQGQIKYCP